MNNRLLIGLDDKTDLQLNLLQHDFVDGLTLIDSNGGDLARKAANRIPRQLVKYAVYFEPTPFRSVGINILDGVHPTQRQQLTDLFCNLIDALFPEGANTLTRINSTHLLANCMRLLLDQKHETLLGILRLLSDKAYLKRCIARQSDPVVKRNWQQILDNPKQYESAIAFVQAKIGMLLMSPLIRNVVAQRTTLKPTDTILIANLDRAKLGDTTARLIGSLLIARSTGRLYVNDFAFFARKSDALATLLAQDRTTLGLNYLDELSPALRQQVLGINEKYVLRSTRRDADDLLSYLGLMNPSVLTDLAPNEVRTSSGQTLFPMPPPSGKRLRAVKRRTRARRTRIAAKIQMHVAKYLESKD